MKKKFLALFISVLLICTIFSGCGDSADIDGDSKTDLSVNTSKDNPTDDSKDDSTDTWTVMLYLCGTDLESGGGAATSNLNEIFASDLSENVNFLIQTGGTQTWHTDGIDSSKLQRFKVENSQLSLIDQQESASMGAADTLGSFLNWGATKYPADKYMVVFWNHGGGSVSGVEFDELYENDSLSLIELADGLSQAKVPFEVIGFDTCLMATLENAVQIAPYGKYMVASEEYEPGGGWQYTSWLNFLSENIASTGKELGTAICDSYYQKCESAENEAMATLSVVDLSKIEALNAAFEKMASEMIGLTTDVTSFQRFAKGASKAENYGGNTNEEGYTNMVDLHDLVANTADVLPETASAVTTALSDAVLYQVKGANRSKANGLAVFFPLSVSPETCDSYAALTKNAAYLRFIDTIAEAWNAPDWVYETEEKNDEAVKSSDYTIKLSHTIDNDGIFILNVESGLEIIESVRFSLDFMNNNEYLRLGLDNDIVADWDKGIFKDNFRGVWASIDNCYVAPELIAEEEDYNLYSIPVKLNDKRTNLRAIYDFKNKAYEILGTYDGIDATTGMSSRNITKLKDGDVLVFLFNSENTSTSETLTYEMGQITYSKDSAMKEISLFNGDYLYQYEITDIFGNVTYSDTVIMECTDGKINIYETEDVE